jgi:AraC-like DNA-binding protein
MRNLFIQNMVSRRCKMFVEAELKKRGLEIEYLELGEVHLKRTITDSELQELTRVLHESGLELMQDDKAILISQIKTIIIEMIHQDEELTKLKFSVFLSEKLHREYPYLSDLFSKTTGMTIEHFVILHKIERAKELLIYNELTLTEIAFHLHYSSVSHLSNQFKKVTGLTPSFFKKMQRRRRINLDDI